METGKQWTESELDDADDLADDRLSFDTSVDCEEDSPASVDSLGIE